MDLFFTRPICRPRRNRYLSHFRAKRAVETLESRRVLAAVPLSDQILIDSIDAAGPTTVQLADIDGDTDLDVIVGSYLDNRVSWFENQNGNFQQHIISENSNEVRSLVADDLDGDGDTDLVVAAYGEDRIEWFENLDGAGSFGPSIDITRSADGVRSVAVGDINGDGRLDIISGSWFDDKVAWYRNLGDGLFTIQQVISTATDGPRSVKGADMNGDGNLDVVVASRLDDSISWFPGNGDGTFANQQSLPVTANGPEAIDVADLDGDGDNDVLAAIYWDSEIVWYENLSPGTFSSEQRLSAGTLRGQAVTAADLDGDGDLDVVAASYLNEDSLESKVAWFENTGQGTFGREQFLAFNSTHGVEAVAAGDLDQDGDQDVVSVSTIDNKISWYQNDGTARFGPQLQIASDAGGLAEIDVADIDGDGDPDILAGNNGDNEVTWYENVGRGQFSKERLISNRVRSLQSVRLADLDGDGDFDALSASYDDDKVAWYENDGQGNFGDQQIINSRLNGAVHVNKADVDHDGDLDVLVAAIQDSSAGWHENLDGKGSFGPYKKLPGFALQAEWITAGDIDGDSDLDLLTAAYGDGRVRWYENVDGRGEFAAGTIIHEGFGANTVEPIDADGDGDLDVAITLYGGNDIVWYENLDGAGTFGESQVVGTLVQRSETLFISDFNRDGREDIVTAGRNEVMWFERTANDWVRHSISADVSGVYDVHVEDIDQDGDLDVLSASAYDSKLAWYENLTVLPASGDLTNDGNVDDADIDRLCLAIRAEDHSSQFDLNGDGFVDRADQEHLVFRLLNSTFGDANLDGIFNSRDFVTVFRAAEYEDGIPNNSGWAEGDWNCSGDFDTRDLVTAFTVGDYVASAHAAQAPGAIIEPSRPMTHDSKQVLDHNLPHPSRPAAVLAIDVVLHEGDIAGSKSPPFHSKRDNSLVRRTEASGRQRFQELVDDAFRDSLFVG